MAVDSTPEASGDEFVDKVLEEYSALYDEIESGDRREIDVRPRQVRRLFCNVLGWSHEDYAQEDEWNDVRFYDEDRTPAIIIEGKRPGVDTATGVPQVFRYASETPYPDHLISTNIDSFKLYERCGPSHPEAVTHHGVSARLVTEINFKSLCEAESGVSGHEDLSAEQRQKIQKLTQLRRSEVLHSDRYEDFSFDGRADISEDSGFRKLIRVLNLCLDDYFLPYAQETFDTFEDRYEEYQTQRQDLTTQIERLEEQDHDESEIAELQKQLSELEDEYEQYIRFHEGFDTWVRLSGRQDDDHEENKLTFCRESVYVQLNKILLIRIAEDKGLTSRMISNGGVDDYFRFWDDYTRYVERNYVDLFELASEELGEIYDRLFARRIFDWEIYDDETNDLNEVIQRTMWHLNHFNFSEVNRDILGHLYEEHLSPEERKELGEFYTPTAIIDLILDSVGYTPDKPLEAEDYDILDPACGSGGFLVRATRRLLERLDRKGTPPIETIKVIRDRIHGFDLNPFACHIAEINLLFQIIDEYQQAKENDPEFTLDGFEIYQTDSLREEDVQQSITAIHSGEVQRQYREERREANRLKRRSDYNFVVGNPPYVRKQNIPEGSAKSDYDDYEVATWNYDLSILFFKKAGDWLDEGGQLGFITSNKFIPNRYGRKVRPYLAQNFRFKYLIDFGDYDLFETPQAYPIIFAGERINKEMRSRPVEEFTPEDYVFTFAEATDALPEITQTAISTESDTGAEGDSENAALVDPDREVGEDPSEGRIADIISACLPVNSDDEPPSLEVIRERLSKIFDTKQFDQPPVEAFQVPSSMISAEEWRFVPADEETALKEIEAGGTQFQAYAEGDEELSKNGVQTGNNDVFKLDEEVLDEYDIEGELVKPLVIGEDINRWHSDAPESPKLLYISNETTLDENSGAEEYLEDRRDDLEDRYCVTDENRRWFDLARNRPDTFGQELIFTPDVSYYSNFWYDPTGEVYGLNSVYVLYIIDNFDPYYQLGVFNSNVVQFFIRRIASSYSSDYLRYQWDYMKRVPLPDPDEAPDNLVSSVRDTAESLSELRRRYVAAKETVETPKRLLESTETKPFTYAGYIDRLGYQDLEGELHPTVDGDTIRFGVSGAAMEFNEQQTAEAVHTLLGILDVDTAADLQELELPPSASELHGLVDRYQEAVEVVETAPEKARRLEKEYNEVVYDLYELDEETRALIEERVVRPENPLEPREID